MGISIYRRQPPPFVVRCLLGVVLDGIMTPLGWAFDKMGRADRMFNGFHQRNLRRLKKINPFQNYTPGAQDVFVATYAKSGTNWMMQIVTQLAWRGRAEFEHIHEFVPWPDSEMFGPIKGFAIPIGNDSVWKASPEHKRAGQDAPELGSHSLLRTGSLHHGHPRSQGYLCFRLPFLQREFDGPRAIYGDVAPALSIGALPRGRIVGDECGKLLGRATTP